MNKTDEAHIKAQAQRARDDAAKRAGKGWNLLGTALRNALISDEIVVMLLAQSDAIMAANPAMKQLAAVAQEALDP